MQERFTAEGRDTITAQELMDALAREAAIDVTHKVRIEGDVTLRPDDYPHPFRVTDGIFTGHFSIAECHFAHSVDLSGCSFQQNVNFAGARIDGNLLLRSATIQRGSHAQDSANLELIAVKGNLVAEALQTDGKLDLTNAQVIGSLNCSSTKERAMICDGDLCLDGAKLLSGASFRAAQIMGDLRLEFVRIEGSLDCSVLKDPPTENGAPVRRTKITGRVMLNGAHVTGDVAFNGARLTGDVILQSASIGCGLSCSPVGDFRTEFGGNVDLAAAKVSGSVDLTGILMREKKDLSLARAKVYGKLACNGAQIGLLNLQLAEIGGGLFLHPLDDQPAKVGEILLWAAHVVGLADLSGAIITGGIDLDGVVIAGNLSCTTRSFTPAGAEKPEWLRPEVTGDVSLRSAEVSGDIDFEGITITGSLIMDGSVIRGKFSCQSLPESKTTIGNGAKCRGVKVGRDASFNGARIYHQLTLIDSVVEGNLWCDLIEVVNKPEPQPDPTAGPTGQPLAGNGDAWMMGVKVSGQVSLSGAIIDGDLNLQNADIRDRLFLTPADSQRTKILGEVSLRGARVTGGSDFSAVMIKRDLILDGAVIADNLCCTTVRFTPAGAEKPEWFHPEVTGDVSLRRAEVSGDIDFEGINVTGSLIMDGSVIRGGFSCRSLTESKTTIGKGASCDGIKVGRDAIFTEARICHALRLSASVVEGNLCCDLIEVNEPEPEPDSTARPTGQPLAGNGDAWMLNVKVSGQVVLNGATIDGNLNLRNADIKDGLDLTPADSRRTKIGHNVYLRGARVTGRSDFSAVIIDGGLQLDGAVIAGNLYCTAVPFMPAGAEKQEWLRPEVARYVSLHRAEVSGDINFGAVIIRGDLDLDGAVIAGNLFCAAELFTPTGAEKPEWLGLEVTGDVSLHSVEVSGDINFEGINIDGKLIMDGSVIRGKLSFLPITGNPHFNGARIGEVLSLRGASIQGPLEFLFSKQEEPLDVGEQIDLEGCQVSHAQIKLVFPPNKLPKKGPNLEGFQFQRLTVRDERTGEESTDEALEIRAFLASTQLFSKSVYNSVEKWLREQGKTDGADNVHLAMRARNRKSMGWAMAAGDWLLCLVYHIRTLHLLIPLFGLLLFSWFLFSSPAPVQPKVLEGARGWTTWDGLWLALQTHCPIISFTAPDKWKPSALSSDPIIIRGVNTGVSYSAYGTIASLLSYVLLPLLLARIIVVVKKEK